MRAAADRGRWARRTRRRRGSRRSRRDGDRAPRASRRRRWRARPRHAPVSPLMMPIANRRTTMISARPPVRTGSSQLGHRIAAEGEDAPRDGKQRRRDGEHPQHQRNGRNATVSPASAGLPTESAERAACAEPSVQPKPAKTKSGATAARRRRATVDPPRSCATWLGRALRIAGLEDERRGRDHGRDDEDDREEHPEIGDEQAAHRRGLGRPALDHLRGRRGSRLEQGHHERGHGGSHRGRARDEPAHEARRSSTT